VTSHLIDNSNKQNITYYNIKYSTWQKYKGLAITVISKYIGKEN